MPWQVTETRGGGLFNKNIASCKLETTSTTGETFPLLVTEYRVQPVEGPVKGGSNSNSLKVAQFLVD